MALKNKKMTLLHLSDLHIRNDAEEKNDRPVVLDPLLERLDADFKDGLRPELVLITGDIAFGGTKAEYDLALPFLGDMLETLQLGKNNLYMVPGNHDVCRKAYRPSEVPSYSSNRAINLELSDDDYRADLLKGMREYFNFIGAHFPHMQSRHGDLVPFVDRFQSVASGLSLGLVGLNSAWMCRACKPGENDSTRIAIGEHQIASAFSELRAKEEVNATLVLFHHPLSWLAHMDRRVCEKYLNRTIALAGHLHEPEGGFFHGISAQMAHIQAGGAYLGSDSPWPNRYHYLSIDPENKTLRLEFRAFSESRRIWHVDAATGDDGAIDLSVGFLGPRAGAPNHDKPLSDCPEFPTAYADWLKENYQSLDATKLNPKAEVRPLSLPELYVPLYCAGFRASGAEEEAREAEKLLMPGTHGKRGEPKDPLIETLVGQSRALLLEGQAGSGKSTVLKHLAYTLSPSTEKMPASASLEGYLPVLILLKDLQAYYAQDITKKERTCSRGEGILQWCLLEHVSAMLSLETLRGFARCGRLLLLVDGLDEIDGALRDYAVKALADELLIHPANKIVLAGRPHGLTGIPNDRFGKFRASVKDLDNDQVQRFVRQWYDYYYPGATGVGKKSADDLLGDLHNHPSIETLTVNPLMLTAICLLYYDERELPDQRAELFKKFIDNMLWRRFEDPEPVLDILKQLAYAMHTQKVRMLDRGVAVTAMAPSIFRESDENDSGFLRRVSRRFKEIEPRCGLLLDKDGQTGFWHLAFQEFLTALYLMDNCPDQRAALAGYWNDNWYKEVIELYVSYLSMEHRQTANGIVNGVVDAEDEAPYRRWRLAARAMIDFHQSRRDHHVVQKVRDRLKLIIQEPLEPETLVDAGESLGWLGDDRELASFAPVSGGKYYLEDKGKVFVEAFEMARYPVTNQLFKHFVDNQGYTTEAYWTEQGKAWLRSTKYTQPSYWQDRKHRCPNQPVTGVSWFEAVAFCKWRTQNDPAYWYFLPSEIQWQAAAAGKEKRKYPWGGDSPSGRCNTHESNIGRPSPVGIFAAGRTPGGKTEAIYDLAGNVWEWTSTNHLTDNAAKDFVYDEDFNVQAKNGVPYLKGGSWDDTADFARCANRVGSDPVFRDFDVGFRCARTLK